MGCGKYGRAGVKGSFAITTFHKPCMAGGIPGGPPLGLSLQNGSACYLPHSPGKKKVCLLRRVNWTQMLQAMGLPWLARLPGKTSSY